jgi:hypothetical protein
MGVRLRIARAWLRWTRNGALANSRLSAAILCGAWRQATNSAPTRRCPNHDNPGAIARDGAAQPGSVLADLHRERDRKRTMRPWSKTELGAKPLEVTPVQATLSLDGSKAVQTGWTMCPHRDSAAR